VASSLEGWQIGRSDDAGDWMPWGSRGDARARVLASADGYTVVLVEAEAGYRGDPHEHGYAEFLYLVSGTLRSQGVDMGPGDAYAAAAGSTHDEFEAVSAASYISIFKL